MFVKKLRLIENTSSIALGIKLTLEGFSSLTPVSHRGDRFGLKFD
ncbi:hypothetical protein [Myxosarcina sp. GI1(2024)]